MAWQDFMQVLYKGKRLVFCSEFGKECVVWLAEGKIYSSDTSKKH
jgi:hypothetical protein